MAEMKRQLEQLIEKDFNEEIMGRKKYGSLPIDVPNEIIKVFSQALADYWDSGRTFGMDQAHKIVHEVVGINMQEELKKHPKMSLRTYAKKYGYISADESHQDCRTCVQDCQFIGCNMPDKHGCDGYIPARRANNG